MIALALWQEPGSLSAGNSQLLMFFVGMVAVAMVVQAIVVVFVARGAAKAQKKIIAIVEEVRTAALPVVNATHGIIHDLQPKVRTITDNFVETSHVVRSKAQEFDATITDVNHRARAQSERVDGMVTSVLDTTAGIANTVQRGVSVPVREFHGIMSGLKAGIDVLVGRKPHEHNGVYREPDIHDIPDL